MSDDRRAAPLKRLDRKVSIQRAFMNFENLWAAWAKPLVVIGGASAIVASGLLNESPAWARFAFLAVALAVLLWSLLPLFRMPQVKRLAVLRKLEQASAQKHRIISSADDALASEVMDPRAETLWEEHKERQLAKLDDVKLVLPLSRWRSFDPYALRVPVVLALVATLILGRGSLLQNLQEATRITTPAPVIPLALDAWLKPPGYTERPPLLITSPNLSEKLASGEPLEVPENSVFTLRISGAAEPNVTFRLLGGDSEIKDIVLKSNLKDGRFTAEATLHRPVIIIVSDGGTTLARWPVTLIPDAAPTLMITEQPKGDPKGALSFKWQAKDDYGVRKVTGELELADEQEGGDGFESNGIFLFDPPALKFALRRANGKDEKGTSRFDLAKHPWAGFNVTLNMTAVDAAGHQGKATPVTFKMPERIFVKPLPRALIEQRKQLVLYPERAGHVGKLIDTLNLYPKDLFEGAAPSIALGAIASRLRNASGYGDVHFAMDQMWDLAVALEEGSLSDLRAELKNLKEELEKALREDAPRERIAELMDKLRSAMNKYLDAMREQAEKNAREGDQQMQLGQDNRFITREQLEKMLKDMEDMSKGGNNDMAQQMLDQLDQLLQNLQPGGQMQRGENSAGEDVMQGLGDMMRKQRRLMDETQRMPGQGQEQGEQEGNQQGEGKGQGQDLADRQGDLGRQLHGLRGQGGTNQNLDDAARAMGEAEDRLRRGDKEGALQKQGEALDKLRKGAQEMAQQLRENGQGQEGAQARDGEGRSGQDDPLGRPRATRNPDTGPADDILPTEEAMQRAREILETLRNKANERGLSDQERSYIDRLLRGLY